MPNVRPTQSCEAGPSAREDAELNRRNFIRAVSAFNLLTLVAPNVFADIAVKENPRHTAYNDLSRVQTALALERLFPLDAAEAQRQIAGLVAATVVLSKAEKKIASPPTGEPSGWNSFRFQDRGMGPSHFAARESVTTYQASKAVKAIVCDTNLFTRNDVGALCQSLARYTNAYESRSATTEEIVVPVARKTLDIVSKMLPSGKLGKLGDIIKDVSSEKGAKLIGQAAGGIAATTVRPEIGLSVTRDRLLSNLFAMAGRSDGIGAQAREALSALKESGLISHTPASLNDASRALLPQRQQTIIAKANKATLARHESEKEAEAAAADLQHEILESAKDVLPGTKSDDKSGNRFNDESEMAKLERNYLEAQSAITLASNLGALLFPGKAAQIGAIQNFALASVNACKTMQLIQTGAMLAGGFTSALSFANAGLAAIALIQSFGKKGPTADELILEGIQKLGKAMEGMQRQLERIEHNQLITIELIQDIWGELRVHDARTMASLNRIENQLEELRKAVKSRAFRDIDERLTVLDTESERVLNSGGPPAPGSKKHLGKVQAFCGYSCTYGEINGQIQGANPILAAKNADTVSGYIGVLPLLYNSTIARDVELLRMPRAPAAAVGVPVLSVSTSAVMPKSSVPNYEYWVKGARLFCRVLSQAPELVDDKEIAKQAQFILDQGLAVQNIVQVLTAKECFEALAIRYKSYVGNLPAKVSKILSETPKEQRRVSTPNESEAAKRARYRSNLAELIRSLIDRELTEDADVLAAVFKAAGTFAVLKEGYSEETAKLFFQNVLIPFSGTEPQALSGRWADQTFDSGLEVFTGGKEFIRNFATEMFSFFHIQDLPAVIGDLSISERKQFIWQLALEDERREICRHAHREHTVAFEKGKAVASVLDRLPRLSREMLFRSPRFEGLREWYHSPERRRLPDSITKEFFEQGIGKENSRLYHWDDLGYFPKNETFERILAARFEHVLEVMEELSGNTRFFSHADRILKWNKLIVRRAELLAVSRDVVAPNFYAAMEFRCNSLDSLYAAVAEIVSLRPEDPINGAPAQAIQILEKLGEENRRRLFNGVAEFENWFEAAKLRRFNAWPICVVKALHYELRCRPINGYWWSDLDCIKEGELALVKAKVDSNIDSLTKPAAPAAPITTPATIPDVDRICAALKSLLEKA